MQRNHFHQSFGQAKDCSSNFKKLIIEREFIPDSSIFLNMTWEVIVTEKKVSLIGKMQEFK